MNNKYAYLTSMIILLLSMPTPAETIREFHQRKCQAGNADSCARAADLLEGEQHAARIVELGDQFAAQVNSAAFEEGNKPLLDLAYPQVLTDYFKAEADNGIKKAVTDEVINLCAGHYHRHWRNRKMWWPTDDAGKPDWSTIYFYIVEHYYGYCLRSAL